MENTYDYTPSSHPTSQEPQAVPPLDDLLRHLSVHTESNANSIGQLGQLLHNYAQTNEQARAETIHANVNRPSGSSVQGPRPREPRPYDGDRTNGLLDDHLRDVTNWIAFYDRRGHWASELEKVETASTYLTGRMHRLYTLSTGRLQTLEAYIGWLKDTFKDNNEQSKLRDEWQGCVQGDRTVMTYAQDLVYLAARINPQKTDNEIKEHFRTGLSSSIQIGMAEHPEWDEVNLNQYIMFADRQQQVEEAKAEVRKRTGGRSGEQGRLLALTNAPRRGGRKFTKQPQRPRKGTPEWQDWCKKASACFGCGSTKHLFRDCPNPAAKERKDSRPGNSKPQTAFTKLRKPGIGQKPPSGKPGRTNPKPQSQLRTLTTKNEGPPGPMEKAEEKGTLEQEESFPPSLQPGFDALNEKERLYTIYSRYIDDSY